MACAHVHTPDPISGVAGERGGTVGVPIATTDNELITRERRGNTKRRGGWNRNTVGCGSEIS